MFYLFTKHIEYQILDCINQECGGAESEKVFEFDKGAFGYGKFKKFAFRLKLYIHFIIWGDLETSAWFYNIYLRPNFYAYWRKLLVLYNCLT